MNDAILLTSRCDEMELDLSMWDDRVFVSNSDRVRRLVCGLEDVTTVCGWLVEKWRYVFATLVVEVLGAGFRLTYVFYPEAGGHFVQVEAEALELPRRFPSLARMIPAIDWHEREASDLFGIHFEGHPRLGEFVLHEGWLTDEQLANGSEACLIPRSPRGANEYSTKAVEAIGAFDMPIGPIFADFAEAAHFRIGTLGEDVIRLDMQFFYKFRGVEQLAEGMPVDRALLLAERFSGSVSLAHSLAFCQAVEAIGRIDVSPRARVLRSILAELERLRSHVANIAGVCNATALAVAQSLAAVLEEDLLRLTCRLVGHRYFFGALAPGGLTTDIADAHLRELASTIDSIMKRLRTLEHLLRESSSFLDRLEEVGVVTEDKARELGLVGPVVRASGLNRDMRTLFPYAAYVKIPVHPVREKEGDGYARLRVWFREAEQAAAIIVELAKSPPEGPVSVEPTTIPAGVALSFVEAPTGAAFHWLRIGEGGIVERYRITPPSFINWRGFQQAAMQFAFQDFPIILATFGLSNAESDR